MHKAASDGQLAALQFVASVDPARLHTLTHDGCTTLHLAAKAGCLPVVQLLVTNKVDPLKLDKQRCTALQWAEGHDHEDVVNFLHSINLL